MLVVTTENVQYNFTNTNVNTEILLLVPHKVGPYDACDSDGIRRKGKGRTGILVRYEYVVLVIISYPCVRSTECVYNVIIIAHVLCLLHGVAPPPIWQLYNILSVRRVGNIICGCKEGKGKICEYAIYILVHVYSVCFIYENASNDGSGLVLAYWWYIYTRMRII